MTTLKEFVMSRACKIGLAVLLVASMVPVAALSAAPAFAEDADAPQATEVESELSLAQPDSDESVEDAAESSASATPDERVAYAADTEDAAIESADEESVVEQADDGIDPDRDGTVTDIEFESLETAVEEPFSFFSPLRLLFGASDRFTAPLASGNYAKWIDRLDLTDAPYGRNFYNILAEASDNDGTKDWLIDSSGAVVLNRANAKVGNAYISPLNSNVVGILAAIVEGNEPTTSSSLTPTETKVKEYISEVYGAFDRDYPTSFWRDIRFGTTFWRPADGSNRTYCLFVLKTADMDIRAKGYQSAENIKRAITELNANAQKIKTAYTESIQGKQDSDYSRVKFYNQWLCEHNEYNTTFKTDPNLQSNKPDVWSAVSALEGRTGADGPVCEGYSRAMKLLCDSDNIGCVLVDGDAPGAGPHMWNYVRVGGNWYGLDITWNNSEGAFERYLLKGSDTFLERHPATNQFVSEGTSFTNGPVLSTEAYDPNSVEFAGIIATADSFAYGDSFALGYSSTSEGTVKFTVSGPATIDETSSYTPAQAAAVGAGPLLTITGVGEVKVTATLTPEGDNSTPLSNTLTLTAVPRPLKVTGTVLASKVYDGTTDATVTTAGQLTTARPDLSYATVGVVEGDTVNVETVAASFDDKTAGTDKAGSVTYKLTGDASTLNKYTLENNEVDATAKGSITKRPVTAYFALTSTRVLTSETLPTGTVRYETATDDRGKLIADDLQPLNANIRMTGMPASMPTDLASGASRTYDVTWVEPGSSLLSAIAASPDGANYDVELSTDTEQNTVELTIVNLLNTSVADAESPVGGATYRVEYTPELNDETVEALKGSGFSSREDITSKLMESLSDQTTNSLNNDRIMVYDMVLYVKNEKGEDVRADETNFPEDGVRVTLSVPDISDPTEFDFYAAHMFTHEVTSGGKTHRAGEIETPEVTANENDISFTLMGFSPVSVAWEEAQQGDAPGDGSNNSGSNNTNPAGKANPNDASTIQTGQSTANGGIAQTGDSLPVAALAVCAIACIALIAFLVIRRNRKGDKK